MNENQSNWSVRPWVLAIFLSVAGLVLNLVIDDGSPLIESPQIKVAVTIFIVVSALCLAFALERSKAWQVVLFALCWGLVLGLVVYNTLAPNQSGIGFSFNFWSGLVAAAIALPIFQTVHQHQAFKLPYVDLHSHAWANVVAWFASWAFVGLSFAFAWLLASLFNLIGFDQLERLLKIDWFIWAFVGASFGAALGVLKENHHVLGSLQNLVMTILSIVAPAFCISLILFLFVLPFAGLQALWDATRGTTPILISCVIGSIVLINAIVRNHQSEESNNRILRLSAIGLAMCVFPLALIALISMYQRIDQYGLTPDRIWGMIAVSAAVIYGVSYLWSVVVRRSYWMDRIRSKNIILAVGLMVLTLCLALPIIDFTRLSVTSQMKRLNSGEVDANTFDFAAFAYDFGTAGRDQLEEFTKSENSDLANGATVALASDNRWNLQRKLQQGESARLIVSDLIVVPKAVNIPPSLAKIIKRQGACVESFCALVWKNNADHAQLLTENCVGASRSRTKTCIPEITKLSRMNDVWQLANTANVRSTWRVQSGPAAADFQRNLNQRRIEIRNVERKQVFIGDQPFGEPFLGAPAEKIEEAQVTE